jgi:hypothetical protein
LAAYCVLVAVVAARVGPALQSRRAAVVVLRLLQAALLPAGLRQAQPLEPVDFLALVGNLVQLEAPQLGL